MKWGPEQEKALSLAGAWLRIKYQPFFYLAGYAGTGKTTLAMHIARHAKGKVAFAAFTGKAAKVMRQKGCAGAKTVHSLIYYTEVDQATGKVFVQIKEHALDDVALVVVDECSMVNEEVGKDLLSFGVPVLVLGDPGQLPPVHGAGFFTTGTPDFMLTEVHRQAKDSPIIRLATDVREGRPLPSCLDEPGLRVVSRAELDRNDVLLADTVIVGRNATRPAFNRRLRELHGFRDRLPMAGETLVCLRNSRNIRQSSVFNGETFQVVKRKRSRKDAHGSIVRLDLSDPDDAARGVFEVSVRHQFFDNEADAARLPHQAHYGLQQFTFGYTITVHKAQGSQWSRVCLFDESDAFREDARKHRYTAITRAAQHLTMVI